MVRGRAVASGLAIVVLIGLCGGCSSSSKSGAAAQHTRTAAQTQALAKARRQAAAARVRLAGAERRVAAQRRAIAAAIRRHNHPATTSTTPTTAASTVVTIPAPGATTTTQPAPTVGSPGGSTSATDLAVIQNMLGRLNSAFRTSVAAGIAASELANYYVSAGVYSSGQCAAFEAAGGGGVVSETLAVQPGSLAPAPGFVDPVLRAVPRGRIYSVVLDEVQTIVPTGEQRQLSVGTHVTVLSGGSARLFLRCS